MRVINYGSISTQDQSQTKNIDIKVTKAFNPKNLAIGLGLMTAGALYIAFTSFKNGADTYIRTESDVLSDLDLMDKVDDVKGVIEKR